jgi:DNA-binding ferritin-like protein (Dps family)
MTARLIDQLTGSLEDKRRYRQHRARVSGFPDGYRESVEAFERYLTYRGAITKGDVLMSMLDDLADLFEQSAADGTSIREVVGEDPVAFAEAFLENYSDGQWIAKERDRLTRAIDAVAGDRR